MCMYAAYERRSNESEAKKELSKVEQYSNELRSLMCEKLRFSAASVHCIIDVCGFSGWYAANERAGHDADADADEDKVGAP